MYRPIFMVHLDERTGQIFILAGVETEIVVNRDGRWEFL